MPRLTRLQPHKLSQDCSLGGDRASSSASGSVSCSEDGRLNNHMQRSGVPRGTG